MNLIGHLYVAYKVLGSLDIYTACGAQIPDIVPFAPNGAFSFEEIHESPDIVYAKYVNINENGKNLALGMMSHSVKFGADKFNRVIIEYLIGSNEILLREYTKRVGICSGLFDSQYTINRVHNYLWLCADYYIIQEYSDFIRNIEKLFPVSNDVRNNVAELLSDAFSKEINLVNANVEFIIGSIVPDTFRNLESYLNYFSSFTKNTGQGDKLDIPETKTFVTELCEKYQDKWDGFLIKIIDEVKMNLVSNNFTNTYN